MRMRFGLLSFRMIVVLSMSLLCAVLFAVKAEQLEQVRDSEWAEQEAQQAEIFDAGKGPDERDHRMNVRYSSVHEWADQVVDIARDASADHRHCHCRSISMLRDEYQYSWQPHERAAEYRENRRNCGYCSPEYGVGEIDQPEA